MFSAQQAVEEFEMAHSAFRQLDGLGGAALRIHLGLGAARDHEFVEDWDEAELRHRRRESQEELRRHIEHGLGRGLLDSLSRIAAVTGDSSDSPRVRETLLLHYRPPEPGAADTLLQGLSRIRNQLSLSQSPRDEWLTWEPYSHWNSALTEIVFSEDNAGRPIYLDVEESVLQQAAELIWQPIRAKPVDVESGFRQSVRRTIAHSARQFRQAPRMSFDDHWIRANRWLSQTENGSSATTEAPPCIALLALFSLAAERMRSDGQMAAHNYYGRLGDLLDLSEEDEEQLGLRYRKHALELWECLNIWLRDAHSRRGLPTAIAFGHFPYISLPISQALVRAEERSRLTEFFSAYRLNPGQQIARDDMEALLDAWIPSNGPNNLKQLWRGGAEVRRRITDVVCMELEHWSGEAPVSEGEGLRNLPVLIAANWFEAPVEEFDPMLLVRASERDYNLLMEEGSDIDEGNVALEPLFEGTFRLTRGDEAANDALLVEALNSGLRLNHADSGTSLFRVSERVIVLLFDELRQLFVESARAELGHELMLLTHQSMLQRLSQVLDEIAEPGFRIVGDDLDGVPDDWAIVVGVRLQRIPVGLSDELKLLEPRSRVQLEFDGGMRLTNDRWYTSSAPTLVVIDVARREFKVELHRESGRAGEPIDLGTHLEEARISLGEHRLADGNYRVVLTTVAQGEYLTSRALRLRTSKTTHLDPPGTLEFGYLSEPDFSPRTAISANELLEEPGRSLRGAVLNQRSGLRAVPDVILGSRLDGMEPFETLEAWVARVAGKVDDSGLEQAQRLLERGFAEYEQGRIQLTKSGQEHLDSIGSLSNGRSQAGSGIGRQDRRLAVDLDQILDALVVCGSGSWNAFRRLIDYSDSERFKPHEALRNLRSLGYVDVEVEPRSSFPKGWSLSPPAIVVMPSRTSAFLTGRRDPDLLERLQTAAEMHVATVTRSKRDGRPERWQIDAEHGGVLAGIGESAGIDVVFDAPRRILERMPTIRSILTAQPVLHLPSDSILKRFNRKQNSWTTATERPLLAGGYQIEDHRTSHAVYTEGIFRQCGSLTAKYAGTAAVGEHIMAYDSETRRLTCLFGARPPGLFERALVLCSGELPEHPGDNTMVYRDVPPQVASWMAAKLGPKGWGS